MFYTSPALTFSARPLAQALVALALILSGVGGVWISPLPAAWATSDPDAQTPAEPTQPQASKVGRMTGLTLPRYVSLKRARVNVRIGPGESYQVKWVFVRQHLPVEIIAEHEHWRKIRDRDGEEGWVHSSLLDGRRYGVVNGERATLWKTPQMGSKIVALAEAQVIVRLKSCDPTWCRIEVDGYRGWLSRSQLWGLYDQETID
jgi:SH3-like domain-containing protein